jgi:hypothetical protein
METVVGLFSSYEAADRAVEALEEAGFTDSVSIIARENVVPQGDERGVGEDPQDVDLTEAPAAQTAGLDDKAGKTIGTGAVGGGVVGGLAGLLIGAGVLAIPGIGPVLAAGGLAAAVSSGAAGAVLGATAGGLLGALASLGLSEEHSQAYAEGVRRGGFLVVVQARDNRGEIAHTILTNAGAINIDEAYANWRAGGWNRFDEQRTPDQDTPGLWGRMGDSGNKDE